MATVVTYNGNQYSVPAYQDTGYAQGSGNLSSYLIALATGSLTLAGGAFALTADANFGANFGLVSIYFKSRSTNPAGAGVVRLANTDVIAWRDNGNSNNLSLAMNATDSGPKTYTIPACGASANFVMDQGNQTIAGAKTFSGAMAVNANITTAFASSGSTIQWQLNNSSNTASSGANLLIVTAGASADNPWIDFRVGGVKDFSIGLDQSNSQQLTISKSTTITAAQNLYVFEDTGNFIPYNDNTQSCGKSGNRWSAVWAGNGTIQTSHSNYKKEIHDLDKNFVVPRGVRFKWKRPMGNDGDREWIGFLADPLQKECYVLDGQGNAQKDGVNLSSVVGNLCAGWWDHDDRIKALEDSLA